MQAEDLREAEAVEITVLVDNHTDGLVTQDSEVVRRPRLALDQALLAEHGLSWLVKVRANGREQVLLADAGASGACFLRNTALLNAPLGSVTAVVLSHGHFDHFGGLTTALQRVRPGAPLVLHPDALLKRRLSFRDTPEPELMPRLDEQTLLAASAAIRKVREPSTLADDLVLLTGQVERVTAFEKPLPGAEKLVDGCWAPDTILDDQSLIIKVKGRGLVVIAGCSHAGIINILRFARKITGVDRIHAVLGGFHLNGPAFDALIGPTIDELLRIAPAHIVPLHCTGWQATAQIAHEMPREFLFNTVGTTYHFSQPS